MVSAADGPVAREGAAMAGPALLERLRARNIRAVSRAISMIENAHPDAQEMVDALALSGGAVIVGVTGVPGAGKSTLVPKLARRFAAGGRSVAILAIDPSSPLSGGAILGDRIRDARLGETGIFFRSIASRGTVGGLSATIDDVVTLLDGAGFDAILIETVGTGQADIAVTRLAQSSIVVTAPGLGDDIQAIKSGILEVADIVAVNKADADPDGAAITARGLRQALAGAQRAEGLHEGANPQAQGRPATWLAPVHVVSALTGEGLDALVAALGAHHAFISASERLEAWRRTRLLLRFEQRLRDALRAALEDGHPQALAETVEAVAARRVSPHEAAARLAARLVPPGDRDENQPEGGPQ